MEKYCKPSSGGGNAGVGRHGRGSRGLGLTVVVWFWSGYIDWGVSISDLVVITDGGPIVTFTFAKMAFDNAVGRRVDDQKFVQMMDDAWAQGMEVHQKSLLFGCDQDPATRCPVCASVWRPCRSSG